MSKSDFPHFIIPDWPKPHNVQAYTTTRQGGVSKKPYDSFNLAWHVGDNIDPVNANHNILKKQLNLPTTPLWLNQQHSTTVIKAQKILTNTLPEADAAYTTEKNLPCAVLTADCLPILLCERQGKAVAAIHAGWRGLLAGIIEQTVTSMPVLPEHLLAWLGPAIGPDVFLLNTQIYQEFIAKNPQIEVAFTSRTGVTQNTEKIASDKADNFQQTNWLTDIYKLAKVMLEDAGVTEVYGGTFCTYSEPELFYSYRRDAKITGRMASLIWIN